MTSTPSGGADQIQFRWELAPSSGSVGDRIAELEQHGATATLDESRVAFIPVIVGAIALVALANMLIDLHHRLTSHGIMVNASDPSNVEIKEDPHLEFGIILVVDPRGTVISYDQRKEAVSVNMLVQALKASAGASG